MLWLLLAVDPSAASRESSEQLAREEAAEEPPEDEVKKNRTMIPVSECCECPKSAEQNRVDEEERRLQIEFQNFLQNTVYRLR